MEVLNLLHYYKRQTEPQQQLICTENFQKFGNMIFEIRQETDTVIAVLHTPNEDKVITLAFLSKTR